VNTQFAYAVTHRGNIAWIAQAQAIHSHQDFRPRVYGKAPEPPVELIGALKDHHCRVAYTLHDADPQVVLVSGLRTKRSEPLAPRRCKLCYMWLRPNRWGRAALSISRCESTRSVPHDFQFQSLHLRLHAAVFRRLFPTKNLDHGPIQSNWIMV
jgi:hypothetical protein